MAGYQLSSNDLKHLPSKYICMQCGFVMREPMQTPCAHFYCKTCLDDLKSGDTIYKCKDDGEEFHLSEVFPDRWVRNEIRDLTVHCLYNDCGCDWEGKITDMESHTKNSCEFLKIPCVHPECGMLVKKADLAEHLENDCMYRLVECRLCHTQIDLNRMTLANHQNPIMGNCEGVQGPCPFSQIGCSKKEVLSQGEKKEHLKQKNTFHTMLILQLALLIGKQLTAIVSRDPRIMSGSPQIFTSYDGVVRDLLSTDITRNLHEKLQMHSERISSLERQMASVSSAQRLFDSEGNLPNADIARRLTNLESKSAVETVKRQVQEATRRTERRMESIEHTLALRNVALVDLQEYVRQQEFPSYDGQLLWRITDYARRRNEAVSRQQVSFCSPCFFTSRYGYKTCARIYLNGDGMGRGTHISVFIVVMRGPYDALQPWPFRHKVTFTLLDQNHVEHVIDGFRPDPNSSSFQRPRREANIASGCPMFCSLAELHNHAYVKDDTMFLKIAVTPVDLVECVTQQLDSLENAPRQRQLVLYDERQERRRLERRLLNLELQIAELVAKLDLRMERVLTQNRVDYQQAQLRQLQEERPRGSS